jgi:hypothetical protein
LTGGDLRPRTIVVPPCVATIRSGIGGHALVEELMHFSHAHFEFLEIQLAVFIGIKQSEDYFEIGHPGQIRPEALEHLLA